MEGDLKSSTRAQTYSLSHRLYPSGALFHALIFGYAESRAPLVFVSVSYSYTKTSVLPSELTIVDRGAHYSGITSTVLRLPLLTSELHPFRQVVDDG